MTIVIVSSEDAFYLPAFFERVLEARTPDVAAIVIPRPRDPRKELRKALRRFWAMFGPWYFMRQALRYLKVRALDRLSFGRGPARSVATVAERYGIPVLRPLDVNAETFLAELKRMDPDVIVSVTGPQIFRKGILELPKFGCINVHGALLPKYRGVFPSFWVLAQGERETGATVHLMDEKLDNGPILVQRRVPITRDDTQHSLLVKTKMAGAEVLLEALDQIERGTVSLQPNDASQATYYSAPGRDDARRFRARGRRPF